MTVRLVSVAIDSAQPLELATFWARALRWELGASDDTGTGLVPRDSTSFYLRFRPGASAKTGQNRIHFDLTTTSLDDQSDTIADLVDRGGAHVDIGQDPDDDHVVLADPEGNELCIIGPDNRFLAGCPRLGAVNCDGTHALGCFWSDALGWPLVWDQDEETAIQAPDGTGPKLTWSGPPLMPRVDPERFHFHVAPGSGVSGQVALDHLLALGATHPVDATACAGAIALADVDGNPFCLLR